MLPATQDSYSFPTCLKYLSCSTKFIMFITNLSTTSFKLYRAISTVCVILKTATNQGDLKIHTNDSCLNKCMLKLSAEI